MGRRFGWRAERLFSFSTNKYRLNLTRKKVARIKGCCTCGEVHRANEFHNPNEFRATLQKKEENSACIEVEDEVDVYFADSDSESENDFEFESDNQKGAYIAMTHDKVSDVNTELSRALSNNACLHSCGFFLHRISEIEKMDQELAKRDRGIGFNEAIIGTGATRSNVMSLGQYLSYCQEHNVPALLEKTCKRIGGLGGGDMRTIGTAVTPVSFPDVGVT